MWRRKRAIPEELDEIDRRVDEFFDRVLSFEPMWDLQTRTLMPLYEIKETRDSVIVHVDLPYVQKEAIRLRVDETSIDLSAELRQPIRYERWGTTQRNCDFNKLSATIALPTEIDPDRVTSKFREGVLTIELLKKSRKRDVKVE